MRGQLITDQKRIASESGGPFTWYLPPEALVLASNEVHVWQASLDIDASYVHSLWQIIAEEERARAEQFYFQKDCERFIATHGLVRLILGRYLGIAPNRLQFRYNQYGKPSLERALVGDNLHFNLSHSNGLALYAITRGREIGIDIEYIRSGLPHENIARRFFSARENAALLSLPPNRQMEAFFNCWTRKEAYIKAKGEGLSFPLDQFTVSLVPGEPAALLATEEGHQETSRWSLYELTLPNNFVAAFAVEGHGSRVMCWQWPSDS